MFFFSLSYAWKTFGVFHASTSDSNSINRFNVIIRNLYAHLFYAPLHRFILWTTVESSLSFVYDGIMCTGKKEISEKRMKSPDERERKIREKTKCVASIWRIQWLCTCWMNTIVESSVVSMAFSILPELNWCHFIHACRLILQSCVFFFALNFCLMHNVNKCNANPISL